MGYNIIVSTVDGKPTTHQVDIEGEIAQRTIDSEINFDTVKLPEDAVVIEQQPDCVQYLASRGLTPSDGLFFYAPSQRDRIIIPVEWQSRPIGFVARAMSADTRSMST